jgi:hypothetical protein
MDARAVSSQVLSRKRDGLFKERAVIYILILLSTFVSSYLYKLRTDGIFNCQATGYSSDRYLSYCGAKNYGIYEEGAFWFGLEPAAKMSATRADVLFVGDSRLQFAFSTAITAQWFSAVSASYYLLGFIGYENSIFARALLHKLKPRATVYILNIADFFQPSETPEAKFIMHDDEARSRYEVKHLWQLVHEPICRKLAAICGHNLALFRSRQTGALQTETYIPQRAFKGYDRPVSYSQQIDEREIDEAIAIGHIFLSEFPVKTGCVILTAIPTVDTKLDTANAIAAGLGKMLMVPEHLEGLQTFDGSHLDIASAERWSKAFFTTAGPQIQRCLESHTSGQ